MGGVKGSPKTAEQGASLRDPQFGDPLIFFGPQKLGAAIFFYKAGK